MHHVYIITKRARRTQGLRGRVVFLLTMFTIKENIDQFSRAMTDRERRQLPFATARAMNDTAKDVLQRSRDEIQRSFDNPTPWTQRAFYATRATKQRPVATIQRKTAQSSRHYLETQADGGLRGQTGLEKMLSRRLKYAGIIQTVTPGSAARLNRYGNITRGHMNQILSSIKAQRDTTANTSEASRKRNRRRPDYFVPRPGSKLSPGVYKRSRATGRLMGKVLNFSEKRASYRRLFHFDRAMADAARKSFPRHFKRRIREALATAR